MQRSALGIARSATPAVRCRSGVHCAPHRLGFPALRCTVKNAAPRPGHGRHCFTASQDEGVRCSAKSDPHGEEAYRAVSNHEAPDGNDGCLKI